MQQLSKLFAQGKLSNAPEIARLLKAALGNRRSAENDRLQRYWKLLDQLTHRSFLSGETQAR